MVFVYRADTYHRHTVLKKAIGALPVWWFTIVLGFLLTDSETQHIRCVMSLVYDPKTGYLVPGIHDTTWSDMVALCSINPHRARLVSGLRDVALSLHGAGCAMLLLDGSFVSQKDLTNDYDGAWNPIGMDPNLVDPVLLDLTPEGRAKMKAKYGGELFIGSFIASPGVLFRDFFQTNRSGNAKGILSIDLGSVK